MSKRTKLVHEVVRIADWHDGSQQHKTNLREIWDPYSRFLQALGISPKRVKDIPVLGLKIFVQHCLARGMAVGSVHNRTSGIRVVMKRSGRDTDHMTNAVLGVPRRDRHGKKVPLSLAEQIVVHQRAHQIDEGFGLTTELQSIFGLRRREALLSPPDLAAWYQAVTDGAGAIHVERGAKGGRPREVSVLEARRPETLSVLARAMEYSQRHNGRLITGRGGDLKSSLNRLKFLYRQAGITGERSSHALRYGYACESAHQRFSRGQTEHEVLVGVASDLGHGEKRERFTLVTYLRSMLDLFARVFQNGRLFKIPKDIRTDSPSPSADRHKPIDTDQAEEASGNYGGIHSLQSGFCHAPRRLARCVSVVWQTLRGADPRPTSGETPKAQTGQSRHARSHPPRSEPRPFGYPAKDLSVLNSPPQNRFLDTKGENSEPAVSQKSEDCTASKKTCSMDYKKLI